MTPPGRQPSAAEAPPSPPTAAQLKWLHRGLSQAGGKLPLFDETGRRVSSRTVHSCIERGWAEPWFANPLKPDWLVCRLTQAGRSLVAAKKAVKTNCECG
ncbi:MAG: hypothetical protein AB7D00_00975 [Rhodospirillaceae bacterium]